MTFTINNLTSRPIIIPLNSGAHVRLSPGEVSGEIHDVELKDNAKISKLEQQLAVAIERRDDADKVRDTVETADESGDKKKSRGSKSG